MRSHLWRDKSRAQRAENHSCVCSFIWLPIRCMQMWLVSLWHVKTTAGQMLLYGMFCRCERMNITHRFQWQFLASDCRATVWCIFCTETSWLQSPYLVKFARLVSFKMLRGTWCLFSFVFIVQTVKKSWDVLFASHQYEIKWVDKWFISVNNFKLSVDSKKIDSKL